MTERRQEWSRRKFGGARGCRRCHGTGVVGTGVWHVVLGGERVEKTRPCACYLVDPAAEKYDNGEQPNNPVTQ